jgi:hypothetical protein
MPTRTDAREWNRTFERYVAVRKTARADIIKEKARDFAFKAFQQLEPTQISRIQAELLQDKRIIKLSVIRLTAKGVSLKGKSTGRRRRVKGGGSKKALTPGNKLVRAYARKLLLSRKRSAGYHRVAFLLLAQKMGKTGAAARVNPRSRLTRSNVSIRNHSLSTEVRLSAVARGLDCPSTSAAMDRAMEIVGADMRKFTADRLRQARREAGFK